MSECLELHGVCVWRVRRIAWQKEGCRAGSLTWNKDFSLEVAAASWAANLSQIFSPTLSHQPVACSKTARSSGRRARATKTRALSLARLVFPFDFLSQYFCSTALHVDKQPEE